MASNYTYLRVTFLLPESKLPFTGALVYHPLRQELVYLPLDSGFGIDQTKVPDQAYCETKWEEALSTKGAKHFNREALKTLGTTMGFFFFIGGHDDWTSA